MSRFDNLFDNSFTGVAGQRGSSATLGNLFADDLKGDEVDFTYSGKKQPKKGETNTQQATASPSISSPPAKEEGKVLFPLTTTLFLFDTTNKSYTDKGKVGSVLVRYSNKTELLVYNKQNETQVQHVITPDFSFAIQNKVYGNFYDSKARNWSLLFANEEDALKLALAITAAKVAASDFHSVKHLDLVVGEKGKGLVAGDAVSIKYSGWLEKDFQRSTLFDSNATAEKDFRFTLGQGKVIKGWDEGIQGMKKGSRRFLVIPSSLGYGSTGAEGKIPPNSNLIFDVTVTRVKRAVVTSTPAPEPVAAPKNSKVAELAERISDVSDEEIHNRSRSGSGVKDDALLSRMAKLGRATGPQVVLPGTSPSKKIDDDLFNPVSHAPQERKTSFSTPPAVNNVPNQQQQSNYQSPYDQQQNPHNHSHQTIQPQQMVQNNQQQPQQQMQYGMDPRMIQSQSPYQQQHQIAGNHYGGSPSVLPPGYSSPGYHPHIFGSVPGGGFQQSPGLQMNESNFVEGRTLQLEIKSNLNHLQTRVDEIHSRLETSSFFKDRDGKGKSGEDFLHGVNLIQAIQRLVDDNEKLRAELASKVDNVEILREKIAKLHEKNEKFIEENNRVMEQRNEALKESGEATRKQLKELIEEKAKLEKEINESHVKITDHDRKHSALSRALVTAQAESDSLREEIEKKNNEISVFQSREVEASQRFKLQAHKIEEEAEAKRNLESQLESLREELSSSKDRESKLNQRLEKEKANFAVERQNHENEKETVEKEMRELQDSLRKQRLSAGIVAKEEIERVEREAETRYRNLFDSKKAELQKAARLDVEMTDKAEWERVAFENGRKNARETILNHEKQEWERVAFEEGKRNGVSSALQSSESASSSTIISLQQSLDEMKKKEEESRAQFNKKSEETVRLSEQLKRLESEKASSSSVSSVPAVSVAPPVVSKGLSKKEVRELKDKFQKEGVEKVKKIMNGLYTTFYEEIDEDEEYPGSDVLSMLRGNIKTITLDLINNAPKEEEEEEEEEEETLPSTQHVVPTVVTSAPESNARTEEKVEEEKVKEVPSRGTMTFLPEFAVSASSIPTLPQEDSEDSKVVSTKPSSLPTLEEEDEKEGEEKRAEQVPLPSDEQEESEAVDESAAIQDDESDDEEAETEVDEGMNRSFPQSPAVSRRVESVPVTPLQVHELEKEEVNENPLSSENVEDNSTDKEEKVEEKENQEKREEQPNVEKEEEVVKEEAKEERKEEEVVVEESKKEVGTPKRNALLFGDDDDDDDSSDPLSFVSPSKPKKVEEESKAQESPKEEKKEILEEKVEEKKLDFKLPSFEDEEEEEKSSPRKRPEPAVDPLVVGTPQLASPFGSGDFGSDSGKKKLALFEDDGQFDASTTFGSSDKVETKKTTPQQSSLFKDSFEGFESEESKGASSFDFNIPTTTPSKSPASKSTKEKAKAALFGEESLFDPLGGGGAIGDDGEDFLSFLSKK
eukprot:TRINITY_DN2301_c0_g3_i1.p1 TRINITY_DN2301_c0_g3~~TRINITY_DN2301_c0_g3_i1.p1  ORF type:complete len:1472 (-),score=805.17 TRINITY_DN2301_c0_g3_i1:58-4473(-)